MTDKIHPLKKIKLIKNKMGFGVVFFRFFYFNGYIFKKTFGNKIIT